MNIEVNHHAGSLRYDMIFHLSCAKIAKIKDIDNKKV